MTDRHVDAVTDRRVIALVGPTAVGKSAIAMSLAQKLDGEIVNADSMALYRGMDIGTAKASAVERAQIPHHVLDIWPVTQAASVADYQEHARAAIDIVLARGRTPILTGGSGLYVQATIDDLDFPGTDPAIRARLEAEVDRDGPEALHRRLSGLDPPAAAANSPQNARRIVRALEVIELTGRPFSAGPGMAAYRSIYPGLRMLGLELELPALDDRIARRVDDMWHRGLVDEVRGLAGHGLRDGVTARRALGYQQVLAFLAGECTEVQAKAETTRATRRFVRRQLSWFRRDPRIHWLPATATAEAGPEALVAMAVRAVAGDQPNG